MNEPTLARATKQAEAMEVLRLLTAPKPPQREPVTNCNRRPKTSRTRRKAKRKAARKARKITRRRK